MKRYRDDSVKPGRGIDGTLGENYSREHAVNPWNSNSKGNRVPDGTGAYTSNDPILRNKLPAEIADSDKRDIWDDVEGQSGPNDRAIRSRGQP
jgi:hypothetical protein